MSVGYTDLRGMGCQKFLQVVKCFCVIFKNLNDSVMDPGWIGTLLLTPKIQLVEDFWGSYPDFL
jgi:hypothetical protein